MSKKAVVRKRPIVGFTLPPDVTDGLKALKARDGMSHSEAVTRAVRKFLIEKGIVKRTK